MRIGEGSGSSGVRDRVYRWMGSSTYLVSTWEEYNPTKRYGILYLGLGGDLAGGHPGFGLPLGRWNIVLRTQDVWG